MWTKAVCLGWVHREVRVWENSTPGPKHQLVALFVTTDSDIQA